jgi:RNA recognition motif-containing protein
MGSKLYVGNLDYQTTSEELQELFAQAGEVVSAKVITDRDTQRSRGFAFVEMVDSETALKAISMFNGHMMNDRALAVSEARPQEPRPIGGNDRGGDRYQSRGFDSRRGGGGGGGRNRRGGGGRSRRY